MKFTELNIFLTFLLFCFSTWIVPKKFVAFYFVLFSLIFIVSYSIADAILILTSSILSYFALEKQVTKVKTIGTILVVIIPFIYMRISTSLITEPIFFLGISYFTLKQIHYIWERYKRNTKPHGYLEYLAFLIFLPTIFIGPINNFNEFIRDFRRRRYDSSQVSFALERIVFGYTKIVLLSNYLTNIKLHEYIADLPVTGYRLYMECLHYGLNLYFQFSGYTDVVIGFSLIAGFRLIENFNKPFLATNISDFWKRWHISLSKWCMNYVFMPVFSKSRNASIAVLVSMLVLGLWHEFTWKYVIWGLFHGFGIVIWQLFQRIKLQRNFKKPVRIFFQTISVLITLNFVILSFAITKEKTLSGSFEIFTMFFNLLK